MPLLSALLVCAAVAFMLGRFVFPSYDVQIVTDKVYTTQAEEVCVREGGVARYFGTEEADGTMKRIESIQCFVPEKVLPFTPEAEIK